MYSPALLQLLNNWPNEVDALLALGDEEFYWEVEHAVDAQFHQSSWHPHEASWVAADADRVLNRMSSGWFDRAEPASPQARYLDPANLEMRDTGTMPPSRLNAEKPERGMWTASFFPSGRTTWDHGETRFRHLERVLCSLQFDDTHVSSYAIHSLEDFAELVRRFPAPGSEGRIRVDWTSVARHFDAVHLTAKGLITADRVPVSTTHGIAELWGWGSQSTVWFNVPPGLRVHATSRVENA